jgi:hypothetical protein
MTWSEHQVVRRPMLECPRCRAENRAAEASSARLRAIGAPDQEVMRARHEPRFATLEAHVAATERI